VYVRERECVFVCLFDVVCLMIMLGVCVRESVCVCV